MNYFYSKTQQDWMESLKEYGMISLETATARNIRLNGVNQLYTEQCLNQPTGLFNDYVLVGIKSRF
jgi:hypothetical protein